MVAFIGNSKKREILSQKKNVFDDLNTLVTDNKQRELEANSWHDEIGLATMPSKTCKDSCHCNPICNCFGGYAGHPEDNYTKTSTTGFVLSCLTTGAVTILNGASTACTIAAATMDEKNPAYQPLFWSGIGTRVAAIGLDKAEQHFKGRNLDRRTEQYDNGIRELIDEIQDSMPQAHQQRTLNIV